MDWKSKFAGLEASGFGPTLWNHINNNTKSRERNRARKSLKDGKRPRPHGLKSFVKDYFDRFVLPADVGSKKLKLAEKVFQHVLLDETGGTAVLDILGVNASPQAAVAPGIRGGPVYYVFSSDEGMTKVAVDPVRSVL